MCWGNFWKSRAEGACHMQHLVFPPKAEEPASSLMVSPVILIMVYCHFSAPTASKRQTLLPLSSRTHHSFKQAASSPPYLLSRRALSHSGPVWGKPMSPQWRSFLCTGCSVVMFLGRLPYHHASTKTLAVIVSLGGLDYCIALSTWGQSYTPTAVIYIHTTYPIQS